MSRIASLNKDNSTIAATIKHQAQPAYSLLVLRWSMSLRHFQVLTTLLLAALIPSRLHAESAWETLQYITEEFPPYNYTEGGVARGISVDILLESAHAAGLFLERKDIRSFPWARGYQMVQKGLA